MSVLKKGWNMVGMQVRERGVVSMLTMNLSHLAGIARGLGYKLVYGRRINGSLFAMQGNSTIELFNRRSRLTIGKFVFIRKNVSIRIDDEGELMLGDHAFINDNCTINCASRITIGRYAKIAPNVCINDHDHNYRQTGDGHLLKGDVVIGEHVWVGSNVVILRGTKIGDHAVIAAGSVVKGDVPPYTVFVNKRENQYIAYEAASPVQRDEERGERAAQ